MEIQTLNDLANDVMVCRLTIDDLERQRDEILKNIPELAKIEEQYKEQALIKSNKQAELLALMTDNELKSWKTEQATYSRAKRVSVSPNPAYKKEVEKRVKAGEEVEGWDAKESTYMSIRINK